MAFKHITSRDNPVFKHLKKLADSSRERKKVNQTLLDGVHLIEGYDSLYGEPETIIIPEGFSTHEATEWIQRFSEVDTILLPTLMFAELSPVVTPTGVMAQINIPTIPHLKNDWILLLEDIQDPGNLGSMLRTASAAGVEVVYLSASCTDAWSPKALRGGQGAQFQLPLVENADLLAVLSDFNGVSMVTTMQGESLYSLDLSGRIALVMGNEGKGVSQAMLKASDKHITIPTSGKVESLNVAAATAVCLFECARQRALN